ncbi:MAG: hypothetical protein JXR96_05015 [Deltaproteobacteria bacterium]|nr:hypothetical protein [Deltaproteobacteria bacterium]
MSRVAVVVLLIVTLGGGATAIHLLVLPRVEEIQLDEVTRGLDLAGRLFQEMDAADEGRLLRRLGELAMRPGLRDLLGKRPAQPAKDKEWLAQLHEEIDSLVTAARQVSPGEVEPVVKDFFVLGPDGLGLARNIDPLWTGKPASDLQPILETVDSARKGVGRVVVFEHDAGLCRAVAVPVGPDKGLLGVLLMTSPLDDHLVKARSSELDLDVDFAYLTAKGIACSNLSDAQLHALDQHLAGEPDFLAALMAGKRPEPFDLNRAEQRLRVAAMPLPGKGRAIAMLRSTRSTNRPLDELRLYIFGGAGVALLLLATLVGVLGGGLARGLRHMEREAFEIAHGEGERVFSEKGPGLVRSLAALVNQIRAQDRQAGGAWPKDVQEREEMSEAAAGAEAGAGAGTAAGIEAAADAAAGAEVGAGAGAGEDVEADAEAAEFGAGEAAAGAEAGAGAGTASSIGAAADAGTAAVAEVGAGAGAGADVETDADAAAGAEAVPGAEAAAGAEIGAGAEAAEVGAGAEAAAGAEAGAGAGTAAGIGAAADAGTAAGVEVGAVAGVGADVETDAEAAIGAEVGAGEAAAGAEAGAGAGAAEAEDFYYRKLFNEFCRAKAGQGDSLDKLDLARFRRKLERQAEALKNRHACRMVRFSVVVKDGKVSLRPEILR